MSDDRKQSNVLRSKAVLRAANIGAYFSLIAASDLVLGLTPALGTVSSLLFGAILLALFVEIDRQLLGDALMPKTAALDVGYAPAKTAVICDIVEKRLSRDATAGEELTQAVIEQRVA